MNLIFAKLFEEYIRKKDPAEFSITMYISIFYFFLSLVILLPIKTFVDKKILHDQVNYEKSFIYLIVFVLLSAITLVVYFLYIRNKHIYKLTEKYKSRKFNKTLLYIIIALMPISLLLLATTFTVLLNGGEIFGNKIEGFIK